MTLDAQPHLGVELAGYTDCLLPLCQRRRYPTARAAHQARSGHVSWSRFPAKKQHDASKQHPNFALACDVGLRWRDQEMTDRSALRRELRSEHAEKANKGALLGAAIVLPIFTLSPRALPVN